MGDLTNFYDARSHTAIAPHEGFMPEAIHLRDYTARSLGGRTIKLVKPPHWADTPGIPCQQVPKDHYGEAIWDGHYDLRGERRLDSENAAAMCSDCPVIEQCLADAMNEERGLDWRSRFMVRGGLTPKGRYELERDQCPSPNGLSA